MDGLLYDSYLLAIVTVYAILRSDLHSFVARIVVTVRHAKYTLQSCMSIKYRYLDHALS